ncbi:MAG: fumarylacetoacetate hydrolase family protein [Acidobacteriaceae bacterium]
MATTTAEGKLPASDNDRMRQAAEILLKARREITPIHELPEKLRPSTLEEAYALQDIMAQALSPIGGWKVGAPSPDATPLFAGMPLWGGFGNSGDHIPGTFRRLRGVEAEIAFCLGKDLPLHAKLYSREEVIDAIASAHPAVELLESAFLDVDKVDRLSMIGDLQINGGFACGAAVPNWQSYNLAEESVTVTIDGKKIFEGKASNPAGTDLLRLIVWLANEGSYRTGGLKSGQWITTGSWSGKALANPGSKVEACFSRFGAVNLQFD